MKFVKFSVFALTLGFFAASCNNDSNTESTTTQDSTTMTAPATTPAPEATPAPATTDTTMAPAAGAPAGDTMSSSSSSTTTEAQKH